MPARPAAWSSPSMSEGSSSSCANTTRRRRTRSPACVASGCSFAGGETMSTAWETTTRIIPREECMRASRRATLATVAGALVLVAAGCGGDDSGGTTTATGGLRPPKLEALKTLGPGEGQVNLVAWAGYVEDGSNDPKVDWVTGFEKATGCQVNVK